jgi:type I restriction enzyme, S subunit
MSDMPPGWALATVGDLAQTVRGLTYKREQARAQAENGLAPNLRATNIQDGRLLLEDDLVFVPESLIREEQWLQPGDIVIASSSGSASLVGKSAALLHPWRGTFGAFCSVLRPSKHVDPRFLAHFVASPRVRAHWSALAAGTNINNLKSAHVAQTEVPLPPLNEQRRIVAAIEEQFSRLDAAEESTRSAAKRLPQLRAAILTSLFSGDWPIESLASITDAERPIRYGILMPKEHIADGVLYVRVKDYPDGRVITDDLRRTSREIAAKYRRATLRAGDVLLAIRGTYGRVAIVPPELEGGNITQDTARISPLPHVDARYVAAYLRSSEAQTYFRRVARGVAVKGVNIGDLRTMPIPVPPLDEQRRILTEVEQQLSLINAMRDAIETAKRRSSSLRRSILERAFRGELVPQDSDDEPASALVERIAADRVVVKSSRRRRVPA